VPAHYLFLFTDPNWKQFHSSVWVPAHYLILPFLSIQIPISMADASAAACSSSMAGYASTSDSQYHDVFINHRGPDVKETFATPLYCSLTGKGLQVFLDKPEMQVGQYILFQIEAAIRVASVHIAIFSPRYAESKWCLDELLWMVKSGKPIIPVFYDVKPEHLRWTVWTGTERDGPYAKALQKHEETQRHGTETIQRWIKALKDVANISGLELEAFNGDQDELLDKLVQIVLQKIPPRLKFGRMFDFKIEEYRRKYPRKKIRRTEEKMESEEAETENRA
jgi:hypothetical protein